MFLDQLFRLLFGAVNLGCGLVLLLLFVFGIGLIFSGAGHVGVIVVACIVLFVASAIRNKDSD